MKKKLLAIICLTIALTITGCGQASADSTYEKEIEELESENEELESENEELESENKELKKEIKELKAQLYGDENSQPEQSEETSEFAELESNDAEIADNEAQNTDTDTGDIPDTDSDDNTNYASETDGIIKKIKVVKITYTTDIMRGGYNTAEKLGTGTTGDVYDYLGISEDGEWFKIRFGLLTGFVNVKTSRLEEITEDEYKEAEQYMKELDGRAQEEEAAENIRKEEEERRNS